MSTFMDIVMSTLIFGILAFTVGRIQVNVNSTKAQNQYNVIVQTNAVELAKLVEYDFNKIGYHAAGQKVLAADSLSITFSGDLENTSVPKIVRYSVGTTGQLTSTSNPNDFPLLRTVNGNTQNINFGLTSFKIIYYDVNNQRIPTPITGIPQLNEIRSIRISFDISSPEPVYSEADTSWETVSWEKTILPRNLSNLNF